jgi:phosphoribosyl-AMP cyclohydrolase
MDEITTQAGATPAGAMQAGATQAGAAQAAVTQAGAAQAAVTQAGATQAAATQAAGGPAATQADPVLEAIGFDVNGLVAAIAQQHDTGEVLMMAWMNAEAVRETLATGRVCYFSRSRGKLWRKGESSGQTQHLKELRVDCDGDTLLLLVQQDGVACHTGRRNCFFRAARDGALVEIAAPEVSPEALYGHTHG